MIIELKKEVRDRCTLTHRRKVYAQGLCFDKLVWVFYAGCIMGYFWEVFLTVFQKGVLESRAGVIYGPFNPIYGFGFVLVLVCLIKFKNPWIMLLVGAVVGGGFEYLLWFFQKLVLNATSWDYHSPFIFNGTVIFEWLYWGGTSFFHAVAWGMIGFVCTRVIYPVISDYVEEIPYKAGKILTWVLVIFMLIDCLLTVVALLRQAVRRACAKSDTCGTPNALERFIDKIYSDEFLKTIFPNMDLGD